MTTTSSEPAGGLQTAPPGSRALLTAAFHPARPNNKSGGLHNEIEAFDRARDPAEHEISFGPYRLLPARRLLLEGDKPVPIGGRALDLLIALRFCHIAGTKKGRGLAIEFRPRSRNELRLGHARDALLDPSIRIRNLRNFTTLNTG